MRKFHNFPKVNVNRTSFIDSVVCCPDPSLFSKPANYVLYIGINKVNDELYIGVTSRTLCVRSGEHLTYAHCGTSLFSKAIRKFGKENFEFIEYARFDNYDDLQEAECELISLVKPEYNSSLGGGFGTLGFKHSLATRQSMSRIRRGRKTVTKGSKHSAETIKNRIAKRREAGNFKPPCKVPVLCVTHNKKFGSIKEAAQTYGIRPAYLGHYLNGFLPIADIDGLVFVRS